MASKKNGSAFFGAKAKFSPSEIGPSVYGLDKPQPSALKWMDAIKAMTDRKKVFGRFPRGTTVGDIMKRPEKRAEKRIIMALEEGKIEDLKMVVIRKDDGSPITFEIWRDYGVLVALNLKQAKALREWLGKAIDENP